MKLITLLLPALYAPLFYFSITPLPRFISFVIGLFLGVGLIIADELFLHRYYQERPSDTTSPAGNAANAAEATSSQPPQLMTHSVLFLLLYVPLAIFMITSSASPIGLGLILGIGLHLSRQLLQVWRKKQDINQLVKAGRKPLSPTEGRWLTIGFVGFFGVLSLLVLFFG